MNDFLVEEGLYFYEFAGNLVEEVLGRGWNVLVLVEYCEVLEEGGLPFIDTEQQFDYLVNMFFVVLLIHWSCLIECLIVILHITEFQLQNHFFPSNMASDNQTERLKYIHKIIIIFKVNQFHN